MSKIDEAFKAWHEAPEDGVTLCQYLGMTWAEYVAWARDGTLPDNSPYREDKEEI